jgi:hypothetical protein
VLELRAQHNKKFHAYPYEMGIQERKMMDSISFIDARKKFLERKLKAEEPIRGIHSWPN